MKTQGQGEASVMTRQAAGGGRGDDRKRNRCSKSGRSIKVRSSKMCAKRGAAGWDKDKTEAGGEGCSAMQQSHTLSTTGSERV